MKTRILLEGAMPQRALNRLGRLGIAVENVKKRKKNQIVFTVSENDSEKIFAIYPSVCYNERGSVAYTAQKLPPRGLERLWKLCKQRIGLLLGAVIFLTATLCLDGFVLSVHVVGETKYEAEIYAVLEEGGVHCFAPYRTGKEDWITARILSLPSISFCSVRKSGTRLIVEVVESSLATPGERQTHLTFPIDGTIKELTVLSGEPRFAVGEFVPAGEIVVAPRRADGENGAAVARACVVCVYERTFTGVDEAQAKAQAYLDTYALEEPVTLCEFSCTAEGDALVVRATYERIFCVNYE